MKCIFRHKWKYEIIDLRMSDVYMYGFNKQYWFPPSVSIKPLRENDIIIEKTEKRICDNCNKKEIKYQKKWIETFLNVEEQRDINLKKLGI